MNGYAILCCISGSNFLRWADEQDDWFGDYTDDEKAYLEGKP